MTKNNNENRITSNGMKKSNKLITHDGSFHTDDIFAAATFSILFKKRGESFEINRTRDEKLIAAGDYVFDVGGIYDPEKNRFDHHQKGGAGKRKNGIEYSSFGLVWKKFGEEICGSKRVADLIEKKLVAPVDAFDNGYDLVENKYDTTPYFIQHAFFAIQPTWREENLSRDQVFLQCTEIAKTILSREIIQMNDTVFAEESLLEIYRNTADKRIIILDQNYPFEYILHDFPEPLYVIYPRKTDNTWGIKTVKDNPKTFVNRKDFPKTWGGLKEEELKKVTGVEDAIFCHRGLFLAVAKSKEGAVKLAQIALES